MQGAGEMLGSLYRLRVGQRLVAIHPPKRDLVRLARGSIGQQVMHQHGVISFSVKFRDRLISGAATPLGEGKSVRI
jgi:hypothetical protein